MRTLNKTINLSLVTALTLQSSLSAGIMENALQNYTPASTYKAKDSSGNAVKTMYYSGGYYFRFNNANSVQPLWAFSPPEIEAGCNGFNLKGMFVSLLGLDQFGAMLQNAGTTLAWGVAVGLIYSLPGISSVFKQLNAWAKDIQKLLSMSCQSGIAIGRAIGENIPGYNKEATDKYIMDKLDNVSLPSFLQGGESEKGKALGLTGLDFNWDSGFSFSGTSEIPDQDKKDAIIAPLQKLFGNHSLGASIFNDYLKLSGASTFKNNLINGIASENDKIFFYKRLYLTYDQPETALSSGVTESILSAEVLSNRIADIEGKTNIGLRFLSYAIFYNLVGDLGYTKDNIDITIKKYNDYFQCSNANPLTPVCPTGMTREQADKAIQKELSEPNLKLGEVSLVGSIGIPDTEQLVQFLLKGEKAISTGTTTNDKKRAFLAPAFIIMSAKEPKVALNNYFISAADNSYNVPFFDGEEFPGTITLAKCSVYHALKNIGIDTITLNEIQSDYSGSPVNCNLYDNMISSDITILADILSKATASEKADGINLLINYHVYLITNAVLKQLKAMTYSDQFIDIKKIATSTTVSAGETPSQNQSVQDHGSKANLMKKLSMFQKTIEEAHAQLDKDYPDATNGVYGDISLSTYFNNLKKSIQERQAPKQ
jgi:hypothetical protein